MSIARVPLFPPWISVDVVAVALPEAGLVVIEQFRARQLVIAVTSAPTAVSVTPPARRRPLYGG
jgi:hypothetical protein